MTTEHCAHCGDNCGDDHRGPHDLPPQRLHTDEAGVLWWTGCCPRCNMAAQLADRLERERANVAAGLSMAIAPQALANYMEGLDFAAEAVADV